MELFRPVKKIADLTQELKKKKKSNFALKKKHALDQEKV